MTNRRNPKANAKAFFKQYNIKTKLDTTNLKSIMYDQGYTVIEFNKELSDKDVFTIVTALDLTEQIKKSKGFTYTDSNYRLVFINENLSEEEKLIVLAHEEGHIYCEHFGYSPIIGNDVSDEFEANEFAHYLLNPSLGYKITSFVRKNMFWFVSAAVLVALISGIMLFRKEAEKQESYYGDYYISSTGGKYHISDCPYIKNNKTSKRMTKDDYYSGEYTPCHSCLSEEAVL